jgi:hypothetical protein
VKEKNRKRNRYHYGEKKSKKQAGKQPLVVCWYEVTGSRLQVSSVGLPYFPVLKTNSATTPSVGCAARHRRGICLGNRFQISGLFSTWESIAS